MRKLFLFFFYFCIVCLSLQAQDLNFPIYTKDKYIPAYYVVPNDEDFIKRDEDSNDMDAQICQLFKLNKETSLILHNTLTDIAGGFHETYRQLYKGIEVEGTKCVVHYNSAGIAKMISGNLKTIENLTITPRITSRQSRSKAIESLKKDESLMTFVRQAEINIDDDSLINCDKGTLVVFLFNNIPHLAYRHHIRSKMHLLNKRIYMDAETGEFLGGYSTLYNTSTNVNTVYSGIRPIETRYLNSRYVLRDNTRGNGIMTFRQEGSDYESIDNSWSNLSYYDRAAIDAHWGIEKTYDFYYSKFGRNSFDNNGSSIISYVNYRINDSDWANAGWNENLNCMMYGRYNNCSMASLDITAHELTHGVTQFTSALIYEKESGAINEGMSDVFGVCVENEYKTNSDIWKIGEDISINVMRDLSNPTCKYYHGNGWVNTNQESTYSNDYCGVHTNSGVFSYWFYLLGHGGSGTNDAGVGYSVSPIGLADAIQICYYANAVFLCSDSNYPDARLCTLLAAQWLGYNSNVLNQINKAWDAVGVKFKCISGPTIPGNSSVYEVQNLPSNCNVSWTFSPNSGTSLPLGAFIPNSPTNNQCTIDNFNKKYINGTLTATIMSSGTAIASLEKDIKSGDGFSATCSQPLGYIEPINGDFLSVNNTSAQFSDNASFAVKKSSSGSYPITITSPYFSDATITHTFISGLSWQHSGNTITLSFPANDNIDPVLVVTGKSSTDYRVYRFSIYSQLDFPLQLTALVQSRTIMLALTPDEEATKDFSIETLNRFANKLSEQTWDVTITEATTGKTIFKSHTKGASLEINAAEWDPGIYIIKASVGNQVLTQKVVMR